jgi:hypothetical protein
VGTPSLAPSDRWGPHRWLRSVRRPDLVGVAAVLVLLVIGGVSDHLLGTRRTAEAGAGAALIVFGFWRVEVLYGVSFALAFLAGAVPSFAPQRQHALLALVLVVVLRELLAGTRLRVHWSLVVWVIAVIACVFSGPLYRGTGPAFVQYVDGPALAIVTGWAARSVRLRRTLLVMPIPLALVQIPVTIGQSAGFVSSLGASAFGSFGDFVTGTLGSSQTGVITLVCVAAAVVITAMALEGQVKRLPALAACVGLLFVGVLAVARVVLFAAPIALGAVMVTQGMIASGSAKVRAVLLAVLTVAIVAPGLVLASDALYPGSTNDISSFSKIEAYLLSPAAGHAERGLQLTQATALARTDGPWKAFLGHGIGATRLDAIGRVNDPGAAGLILTQAQQDSDVWVPRLLVEGGYALVVAFFVMLAGLWRLAIRARARAEPGSFDSAAALALSGMIPLMFLASFYVGAPVEPTIALGFWTLVGLNIAIASGPRSQLRLVGRPS